MANVTIVYWSGTGNTERMANLIEEGAAAAGATVKNASVDQITDDEALAADVLLLGCAAMGDEVLEEDSYEPFIERITPKLKGKKIALFGSYDWGDGQWLRDWTDRMNAADATLVQDFLMVHELPEGDDEDACREWGKAAANA